MATHSPPPEHVSEKGGSSTGRKSTDGTTPRKSQSIDQRPELQKADTRLERPRQADNPDDVFAHLPADEADVLKRQTIIPQVKTGFLLLYRYAERKDLWIIFISAICAIVGGAAFPLMTIVFGNLQGVFQKYFLGQMTYGQFTDEMAHYVLYFVYLAIGEFIVIYISTVGFICKFRVEILPLLTRTYTAVSGALC
jgi:ATP-binding cassette subfamily B (MDR/TAP) protein 1